MSSVKRRYKLSVDTNEFKEVCRSMVSFIFTINQNTYMKIFNELIDLKLM